MRLFGLIGASLSHSFSREYFRNKFKTEQIPDTDYRLFELSSLDELLPFIEKNPSLSGFNVTIPYKQSIIPFLHEQDRIVRETGSCNTVFIHRQQGIALSGYNTDYDGFRQSLLDFIPASLKRALILGNGGSAQTVKLVLDELQIAYVTVSRSATAPGKGEKIIRYQDLTEAMVSETPLLINTTPLGMFPDVQKKVEIPYPAITPRHYLMDLIYNPSETLFLQEGKKRGAAVRNGLQMLGIQAEQSWKLWNGYK